MKKKILIILCVIMAVVGTCFMAGCTNYSKNEIIGTFMSEDETKYMVIEHYKSIKGDYKYDNHYKMTLYEEYEFFAVDGSHELRFKIRDSIFLIIFNSEYNKYHLYNLDTDEDMVSGSVSIFDHFSSRVFVNIDLGYIIVSDKDDDWSMSFPRTTTPLDTWKADRIEQWESQH